MHKEDFQIFNNYINAKDNTEHASMTYLDTAASSLTPDYVVEKMNDYYFNYRSNIDRGLYKSAERATSEYEESRKKIANFINANDDEVIFTGGATASANLITGLIEKNINILIKKEKDITENKIKIFTTRYEHHSSFLPAQEMCKNLNGQFVYDFGYADFAFITHDSNVTGEIFDIKSTVEKLRKYNKNIFIVLDATASLGHIKVDVKDLDVDAMFFAAHKMCGPTGVGVLYIKRELSREMNPAAFGGGMVSEVSDVTSTYRSDIKRFEAGTGNIAGVIGFGAAIDYINNLGIEKIRNHTKEITSHAISELKKLEEGNLIKLFTEKNIEKNVGIISFEVYKKEVLPSPPKEGGETNTVIHPHDIAQILANNHVAVRSGHHCAQPLMRELRVTSLTRASFYFYNTKEDVDMLILSIKKAIEIFSK